MIAAYEKLHNEIDDTKSSIRMINELQDIKANPVVKATIISLIKTIPIFGELIDASIDATLTKFQAKKRNELLDIILSDSERITPDMVNDVEFIINFAKTLEAVNRLATNGKVEYFAYLLKNGYFTDEKIQNDRFEEYLHIISTLSHREIEYLLFLYRYQHSSNIGFYKNKSEYMDEFNMRFESKFDCEYNDYINIYKRLCSTGMVHEYFKASKPSISKNRVTNEYDDEFTASGIDIETEYFWVCDEFTEFAKLICDDED